MKEKKSDHRKHISNTLEDSEKDPRKFWRTIKKNLQSNVLVQHTVITEKWFDHFHQVFNGDIVNDTDVDAIDKPLINTDNESAALDEDITQLEVQDAYYTTGSTGCNQSFAKLQGSRSGWFK